MKKLSAVHLGVPRNAARHGFNAEIDAEAAACVILNITRGAILPRLIGGSRALTHRNAAS